MRHGTASGWQPRAHVQRTPNVVRKCKHVLRPRPRKHLDQDLVKPLVNPAVVCKYARCQRGVICCSQSRAPRVPFGVMPLVQWCLNMPCVTSGCRRSAQGHFVLDYRFVGTSKVLLVCCRHVGHASHTKEGGDAVHGTCNVRSTFVALGIVEA